MKKVCVITGGGSGMGLATAKLMGKDHVILIAGRTVNKLKGAIDELTQLGIEAEAYPCDVSDRASVKKLAAFAATKGEIKSVIHAAGVSPHMSNMDQILVINALGTVYVNEVFYDYMQEGSCLINVSSMAGHMIPPMLLPKKTYALAKTNQQAFLKKLRNRLCLAPSKHRSGVAYGMTKNFVVWFTKANAAKFATKGIRILSISPGFFETPMGEAEKDGSEMFLKRSAIKRYGKVDEIAHLFWYVSSEKLGYLTGVDILCDGGCMAATMTK